MACRPAWPRSARSRHPAAGRSREEAWRPPATVGLPPRKAIAVLATKTCRPSRSVSSVPDRPRAEATAVDQPSDALDVGGRIAPALRGMHDNPGRSHGRDENDGHGVNRAKNLGAPRPSRAGRHGHRRGGAAPGTWSRASRGPRRSDQAGPGQTRTEPATLATTARSGRPGSGHGARPGPSALRRPAEAALAQRVATGSRLGGGDRTG